MYTKYLALVALIGSLNVYAQDVSAPAQIETSVPASRIGPVQNETDSPKQTSGDTNSVTESSGTGKDSSVLISEQAPIEAPTQALPAGEVKSDSPENPVASSPVANPEQGASPEVVNLTPSQDGLVGVTQAPEGSNNQSGSATPVVSQGDQTPVPPTSPDAVNGNSGVSREARKAARDEYKAARVAARDERKEAMKKFREDMKAARALPDGERKAAMDAARAERKIAIQKFRDAMKAAREKFLAAIGRGNRESIAVGEPVKEVLDQSKEEVQGSSDAQLAATEPAKEEVVPTTEASPARDIAASPETISSPKVSCDIALGPGETCPQKSSSAVRR